MLCAFIYGYEYEYMCMDLHFSLSLYIDRGINISQKSKTNKLFEVLLCSSSLATTEVLINFLSLSEQFLRGKGKGKNQEAICIGVGMRVDPDCSPEHCKYCVLDPLSPGCCNQINNYNKKRSHVSRRQFFIDNFRGFDLRFLFNETPSNLMSCRLVWRTRRNSCHWSDLGLVTQTTYNYWTQKCTTSVFKILL